MKIVLTEPLGISPELLEKYARELRELGHRFMACPHRPESLAELCSLVEDADAVMLANMPFPGEAVRAGKSLRYIDVAFTGVDHVDLAACRERGVAVSNASGYSDTAVAELAFGLMLGLSRRILSCDRTVRGGGTREGLIGTELWGKTLGVVGTGRIGGQVIGLALAFGMRVLAHSRTVKPELEAQGVDFVPLAQLMEQSDVVTLHIPQNAETTGLISRALLERMKPNALLINTARGPVVDNTALADLLREGRIAGAGIDVFQQEPPIPQDHPLLTAPNTLLAPHVAFATQEALERRAAIVFDNMKSWLNGTVKNQVC